MCSSHSGLVIDMEITQSAHSLPTGLGSQGPSHHLCTLSFPILPGPIDSKTAHSCFGYTKAFKKFHSKTADMRATCSLLGDFCISQLLSMSI